MSLKKGRAIVLRRFPAGEKDLVAEILIDTGERRLLRLHGILSSKKRSPVLAEPGSLIEIDASDPFGPHEGKQAELSLREGTVIERFESLKSDYRRQDFLARILKLARIVASGEPDRSHFGLVLGALEYAAGAVVPADSSSSDPHALEAFLIFFVVRVLSSMGLLGDPGHCGACGRPIASGPEGRAAWGEGAFFLCAECSQTADPAGAISAEMVTAMSADRYRNVRTRLETLDHEMFQRLKAGLQRAMHYSVPNAPDIFD